MKTSGDTAYDSSGNNYTGSVSISNRVSGPFGDSAYKFDGSSDNVNIGSSIVDEIDQSSFSVSAWVNPDPDSDYYDSILSNYDGNKWYIFAIGGSGIDFAVDDGSTKSQVIDVGSVPSDKWTHIAAVRDVGNQIKAYVDGVLVGSAADQTTGSISGSEPTRIGAYGQDQRFFDGSISNVRLYNRVLTPQEVSYLYEQKF